MSDAKISVGTTVFSYDNHFICDNDLCKLTYAELIQLVEETKEAKDEIESENIFLQNYLHNTKACKAHGFHDKSFYQCFQSGELLDSSKSHSDYSSNTYVPIEQKCEMVAFEIDAIKEKLTKLHVQWYNSITPYKVKSEELILESRDLQLDYANFTRDVLIDGINAGQVMLEKVDQFFQRSIRYKDGQIERCRRDHSNLLKLERKIEQQLKTKPNLSSTLREIDYDQLKIENASLCETIEDKDKALQKIKYVMSLMVHCLNQHKTKLKQSLTQENEIKDRIQTQHENIAKLEKEILLVQDEENKMNRDVSNLKHQLKNYRFPDVADYIHTQAEIYELNKILKVWQRRVNIASRSHSTKSKFWNRLKKKMKIDDSVLKAKIDIKLMEDQEIDN